MNKRMLFIASCVSLVTTSMVFTIRGDAEKEMIEAFHLTNEQMGIIWAPAFWGFTVAIFISGAVVDVLGMRLLHALSSIGYIAAIGMLLFAPAPAGPVENIFTTTGTLIWYVAFLIMGLSQGLVEGVINPLIATIYHENKTKKLNMLHAWWPAGLMIGGLAALGLRQVGIGWQMKMSIILLPAVVYLIMAVGLCYPATERVTSKVPTRVMFKEAFSPLFLLLFACMWLTAATELGPDQWFPSFMGTLVPQFAGVLFLVYTAGLMFVLRLFAGPIAHKLSPMGMLTACAVISAAGLFWLGNLEKGVSPGIAIAAATVFGIGKTYFWPTMLGVTSERFPRGGALLMSLMGGAGMLSVGLVLPIMGKMFDEHSAARAFRFVAILPAVLTFVFGALYLYFRMRGGYKQIKLATEEPVSAGEM